MTTTNAVTFGTAKAASSEKTWGQLQVRADQKSVSLAVAVIHGAHPGPHFVAMAGIHGAELNGVAAIRSFYDKVNPAEVRGTIFLILCANPRAAMMKAYVWPEARDAELIAEYGDGPYPQALEGVDKQALNMQRLWPGRTDGLFAERITHEIWTQAIMAPHRQADLVLDMHCYHQETPGAMVVPDDAMLSFGTAGGVPHVLLMRDKPDTPFCTSVCRRAGINAVILENSGQGCVTPDGAAEGERVLFNLGRYLGILRSALELPEQAIVIDPWQDDELDELDESTSIAMVRAEQAGLYIPARHPIEIVQEGDFLGRLIDLYTGDVLQEVYAARSGCLYNAGASLGICKKGQKLAGVCIYANVIPTEVLAEHPFEHHHSRSPS